jgi:DNA polymerase-3 subunit gamma/tau
MKNNMPFHRKYRITTLDDFVGDSHMVDSLKGLIKNGEGRTILFHGPRGCGKTSLARVFANSVGAHKRYISEYDLADVGLKETGRKLKDSIGIHPLTGKIKVYILDEIQDASAGFISTILKATEEPPSFVYFILCTTNPSKLPATLRSRCVQYGVQPLSYREIFRLLVRVVKKEKKSKSFDKELVRKIAKKSEGYPREALTLLESVIGLRRESAENLIDQFSASEEDGNIKDLCNLILTKPKWGDLMRQINSIKAPPETIRRGIYNWFGGYMANSPKPFFAAVMDLFEKPIYDNGKAELIRCCYDLVFGDIVESDVPF